ncbi:E3 ubiquitin-protein ligase UPL6-like isoform X5 [Arachis stenosperma]|uniref:E3 ubiquitin-protein ligase UPL6-like isoform X5 n=1 Tax=Arachis stenosperma TaxID=217475 RepID=UPI0025AB8FA6|nr:E3 ubiquitin-protein ligase UPL6-like isoform X5 [Arachis stenosperma]
MFFSGDPSTRKRIDLGGRSSKERDRKNLLEQTRLERNRRMWLRQQNSAAIKIQKCYRGRKVVRNEQSKLREKCHKIYGKYCQNLDRSAFGPDSDFLRQFLFFFNAENNDDVLALVNICRLLQQFVQQSGDVVGLFSGLDYSSTCPLVNYRVKQLVYTCIRALHQNRNQLKDQFLLAPEESSVTAIPLLEVLVLLIDIKLPWSCKIVGHMFQNNAFRLLREIILTAKDDVDNRIYPAKGSSLERVLTVVMCHIGQKPCICSYFDLRYGFSSQILTIPFLWDAFPDLRQVYATQDLNQHYVHQMATLVPDLINFLPKDISDEIPTYACLLGNILETAGIALSQPDCSFDMAMDLAAIATFLLESHPSLKLLNKKEISDSVTREDDTGDDEVMEVALDRKLEQQICNAIDTRFLLQLTNMLFRDISSVNGSDYGPDDREVAAVGAICGFLYVIFNTLPLERIMTVLAYRTELVPMLWKFMKQCHENKQWLSLSERLSYLSGDAPGWLLPLAVFCPVYKHMLMIVDNEEFYEQGKPLSLEDIRSLIILLKQVLWQLLWVNHTSSATPVKSVPVTTVSKRQSIEAIQQRVSIVVSELLSQLQDWNNRRQFTSPTDFHADGVNDSFISQALMEKTRANEVLKQAALLIPFTSRVKIFTSQLADLFFHQSQLADVRQQHGSQALFTRNRFRIRRDHILEDAYNQMSQLSEDDLQGLIRVSFVNEFGVEEAGIDGGGIFKDFMENITRAAFDVQYGLFKETADHQLYPNPGSGMIHEQHLQFFHFLGTLLAKAMFEGILVDLPFATFFLSKLKLKHNYLNDLPSLDPELYRHLIFLKQRLFVFCGRGWGCSTRSLLLYCLGYGVPGGEVEFNSYSLGELIIDCLHGMAGAEPLIHCPP